MFNWMCRMEEETRLYMCYWFYFNFTLIAFFNILIFQQTRKNYLSSFI